MGASSESLVAALSNSCGFKKGSIAGEGFLLYSILFVMIAGDPTTVGRDSRQLLHSHWSHAFSLSGILGVWHRA